MSVQDRIPEVCQAAQPPLSLKALSCRLQLEAPGPAGVGQGSLSWGHRSQGSPRWGAPRRGPFVSELPPGAGGMVSVPHGSLWALVAPALDPPPISAFLRHSCARLPVPAL